LILWNKYNRIASSTRRVLTYDNWSPNFDENFVEIKCFVDGYTREKSRTHPNWNGETTYYCRICIWGGDDTGREKDFITESFEEAMQFYKKWIKWMGELSVIGFVELRLLGFGVA